MKSKQDVKYLIAAMTLSLGTCTTLLATEYSKASETEPTTVAAEEIPAIELVEPTEKLDIPLLAQPETISTAENISEVNTQSVESATEQVQANEAESKSVVTSVSGEPMPIVENKTNDYIPLVEGAIIFSNEDDALPAVVNYYTQASVEEVIDFYQQNFGDTITQESKRGRLTLTYHVDNLAKRVVISEQSGKRQVDVIVEEK